MIGDTSDERIDLCDFLLARPVKGEVICPVFWQARYRIGQGLPCEQEGCRSERFGRIADA